jgi:hypothetical protein
MGMSKFEFSLLLFVPLILPDGRSYLQLFGNHFGACHYARSRKVAGSVPDEMNVFFFNLPNAFCRTVPHKKHMPPRFDTGIA